MVAEVRRDIRIKSASAYTQCATCVIDCPPVAGWYGERLTR